ncbi:hypothetical protein AC1031_008155 [Aphanomyces cochlioides]|nr:hypothetical protein AC1031_008155 [Aphanomyces cochlioides]
MLMPLATAQRSDASHTRRLTSSNEILSQPEYAISTCSHKFQSLDHNLILYCVRPRLDTLVCTYESFFALASIKNPGAAAFELTSSCHSPLGDKPGNLQYIRWRNLDESSMHSFWRSSASRESKRRESNVSASASS